MYKIQKDEYDIKVILKELKIMTKKMTKKIENYEGNIENLNVTSHDVNSIAAIKEGYNYEQQATAFDEKQLPQNVASFCWRFVVNTRQRAQPHYSGFAGPGTLEVWPGIHRRGRETRRLHGRAQSKQSRSRHKIYKTVSGGARKPWYNHHTTGCVDGPFLAWTVSFDECFALTCTSPCSLYVCRTNHHWQTRTVPHQELLKSRSSGCATTRGCRQTHNLSAAL